MVTVIVEVSASEADMRRLNSQRPGEPRWGVTVGRGRRLQEMRGDRAWRQHAAHRGGGAGGGTSGWHVGGAGGGRGTGGGRECGGARGGGIPH